MSTRRLPAWPGDLPEPDALARDTATALPGLERILERARQDDVVPAARSPGSAADATRHTLEDSGRVDAVTDRLRLLGYLPRGKRAIPPSGLDAALRRFQAEAGLAADGAPGPLTWSALDRLVTFETPTRVHARIDAGGADPALRRAVRLRLRALGFLDPRDATQSDIAPALDLAALGAFWRMAQRLRIVPFGRRWPSAAAAIELLFDQDRLIRGAGESARRVRGRRYFSYLKRSDETEAAIEPALGRFLVRLARVELWLLGHDVRIDANATYPVRGFEQAPRRRRDADLRRALREFSRLADAGSQTELTPELFIALAEPAQDLRRAAVRDQSEHTDQSGSDPARLALERLRDQADVEAAWGKARSLGARLWDGFRRLLGWLRRGVRAILDIGLNLARAFLRSAIEAWEIARFAAREATRAMGAWLRGHLPLDLPAADAPATGSTQVAISKDGDMLVRLRARADTAQIDAAARATLRFGAGFHLAMRILATVIAVLRGALSGAAGRITGWARVLRALVACHRDIRPIHAELSALTDWR